MTPAPAARPAVSVIVVHYRTPELLGPALDAVAAQLGALALRFEILVVDNSADAGRLEGDGVRVLEPGANLGYAGGAALGAESSNGEVLVVMNPDVLVAPHCLGRLLDALAAGAPVAGPRFFWDEGRRVVLPPGERRDFLSELLGAFAAGSPRLARVARRRWRGHAKRHWQATGPIESYELSGALLAIRRDAWQRVGPFDAGYPLYFEETDWLLRARRAGLRPLYVPAATALHRFDQSAGAEPGKTEWYALSCRRFRERHHGRLAARLLERVESSPARPPRLGAWPPAGDVGQGPRWLELSPRPCGVPAAADVSVEDLASWRLPADVRRHHPGLRLHLTLCAASGRELGRYTFQDEQDGSASGPAQ
jgi:GT2 family glycosyltransferase